MCESIGHRPLLSGCPKGRTGRHFRLTDCHMTALSTGKLTDRWTDGQTDGRTDGWTGGMYEGSGMISASVEALVRW